MNAALKLSDPQRIILRLRELRLPQDNEAQMQTAFAEVLDQLRIVNTREHRFNATDRCRIPEGVSRINPHTFRSRSIASTAIS